MVKKLILTKIDMKTLLKAVLLDFLVTFQHILFFFFYISHLQMGKSIPNWLFQAIKIQRDLRS